MTIVSSWVRAVCWTVLGVKIIFKSRPWGSVACVYPGTSYADFQALLRAPSKGKWVWAFYYTRPYQIAIGV